MLATCYRLLKKLANSKISSPCTLGMDQLCCLQRIEKRCRIQCGLDLSA
jgi:hypothetical protein